MGKKHETTRNLRNSVWSQNKAGSWSLIAESFGYCFLCVVNFWRYEFLGAVKGSMKNRSWYETTEHTEKFSVYSPKVSSNNWGIVSSFIALHGRVSALNIVKWQNDTAEIWCGVKTNYSYLTFLQERIYARRFRGSSCSYNRILCLCNSLSAKISDKYK